MIDTVTARVRSMLCVATAIRTVATTQALLIHVGNASDYPQALRLAQTIERLSY